MFRDPNNLAGMYILGPDHKAISCPDTLRWAKWFETADRHVAQTTVGSTWVSTVFLGIDHQFGDGPPLVFETMTFPLNANGERDASGEETYRYATWSDAEAGHAAVVKRLQKQLQTASLLEEGKQA